jgi:hypothetical protein
MLTPSHNFESFRGGLYCLSPNELSSYFCISTFKDKPSALSHPFSVNNLMLYNGQDHLSSAAAQFALSRNLYHQSAAAAALYHSSPDLARLASWWPAAAAGLYNPLSSPHLRDTFPFSSAFSAANYAAAANVQQAAAAAAFSRFNPSLFLPPPPPSTSTSSSASNHSNMNMNHHGAMSASASPSSSSSHHNRQHSNSYGSSRSVPPGDLRHSHSNSHGSPAHRHGNHTGSHKYVVFGSVNIAQVI